MFRACQQQFFFNKQILITYPRRYQFREKIRNNYDWDTIGSMKALLFLRGFTTGMMIAFIVAEIAFWPGGDDEKIMGDDFFQGFFQRINNSAIKKQPATNDMAIKLNTTEIAGYKKQIDELIRTAFYSRIINKYAKAYGIQHARGILLYGPPGTGKTTIARGISKSFPHVAVISGPQLKHWHVGKSECMLRDLFKPAIKAWKANGQNSDTYVYIFDEIDVLFPKRSSNDGGRGSVRSDNSMTSQLLTLLDGVDSPKNILIIGTTNRKEALDPALLRPGRLEVHIEIPLPDENDRLEILTLMTKSVRDNNLLDNVDLAYWAKKTHFFTGAEIEYLIKKSIQYAMDNNVEQCDSNAITIKSNIKDIKQLTRVTQEDFMKSFNEIIPQVHSSDSKAITNSIEDLDFMENKFF
jgi:vesicle-fusing ATPase